MGPVPDADLASARFAEVVLRHCTDRVPPPAAELDDNQRVELSLIPTGSLPPGLTQAAIDQAIARHEQARLDEAAKDDEQSYEGTTDGRDAD
jgi:hypothetical protein